MEINEIVQGLYEFANSNRGTDTYMNITKENAIRLSNYIDNLEDKEEILYLILGGRNV